MADKSNPLQNWTKAEKFYLFEALKSSEPVNIQVLRERIPTKTAEELKAGVEEFRKITARHPHFETSAGAAGGADAVLTQWQQLLTGSMDPAELRTQTADAVRMIAASEDIPPPEQTNNIDFREVYKQIANAMEGKPITADKGTAAVLQKCINETALRSKAHMNPQLLNFMKNLNVADKDASPPVLPNATDDPELACLRYFTSQKSYNPFNLSEELLKLKPDTEDDEDDD